MLSRAAGLPLSLVPSSRIVGRLALTTRAAPMAPSGSSSRSGTPAATYDLCVIGGGSGGMAAAQEAARLGARVALFDYVKPSTQGTQWGVGGTCVNVGCVPKKLMHYAGLLGAAQHDARHFGWQLPEAGTQHDWGTLVEAVQNQVHQLNFSYRVGLRTAGIEYINALAKFASPHEVAYTNKGEECLLRASKYIIAVGGRPLVPDDVAGAREHAITSDDIFSLARSPGKTLIVGGSYIALETAGFLHELGYPVTVAVRSILLRGFDRQCSEKVGALMVAAGVPMTYSNLPARIAKTDAGRLSVTFRDGAQDEFDTVLYATGRSPDTSGLALDVAGVKIDARGYIVIDAAEATSVPHIFAIGDTAKGRPELTPVAIRAGELLARRLFAGSSQLFDYNFIPTTIFTPIEYGFVGLSEEAAIEKYGAEGVETYLYEWTTLELQAAHREKAVAVRENEYDVDFPAVCLGKLVCAKAEDERVVGFHFVGPNAGEVTQGFALSLRLGATKRHFDELVGIHPTDAEAFTSMTVTRSSGLSWLSAGGCGGGKCG